MSEDRSTLERELERLSPPRIPFDQLVQRRDRKRRDQRIRAGALGIAVVIAVGWLGVNAIRSTEVPADDPTPTPAPSDDLGIFAPVSGRIAYQRLVGGHFAGLYAVDPYASDAFRSQVQLSSNLSTEGAEPLGWSSDGTDLLIMRGEEIQARLLSILHADGSETQVTTEPMFIPGASISPDGSRVVFAGWAESGQALYAVDAEGGRPEVLLEPGEYYVQAPTFSPDGTRIAYVIDAGAGEYPYSVWVMDADGSDAHEIVTTDGAYVIGLAWSPAGDRIALGLSIEESSAIYTFAPDGSDFARVIAPGILPYWSPDGSEIAYTIECYEGLEGCPSIDGSDRVLAVANADGSDRRVFGFANSGPWHPGASVEEPVPTATPTPVAPSGPSALAYGVDGDVFLADADGANAVRIADGVPVDGADGCAPGEERAEYAVFGTAWSPDGRYLAFWDWGCPVPPGAWGTVLIRDAAGNRVASFPGQGWTISWSPDSTRVAVWDKWGEGDTTIGVYGLDGERRAALTVPSALMPYGDYSPVWSRDGASLLLPGVQIPFDGDAPLPVPKDDLSYPWFAAYSPDGSRVAYVDNGSLVIADADGPDAQTVGGAIEWFWEVAWSPNGDLVAFEGDGTELLVRDAATGADTSLVDVPRSERLDVVEFTLDGKRILFTRSDADGGASSLWSVGVDGSDLRRLLDGIDWADLRPRTGTP